MRTMKTRSGGGPLGVMTTVYQRHYRSLVRLAALLVSDLATAEDIVQDAFAAAHDMWDALPERHRRRAVLPAPVGGPPLPVGAARPVDRRPPAGLRRRVGAVGSSRTPA